MRPDPSKCLMTVIHHDVDATKRIMDGLSAKEAIKTVTITDAPPTLEEMRKLIGGYVEMYVAKLDGHDAQVFFNEDGLMLKLPPNSAASILFEGQINMGWGAVGTVVALQGKGWE